MKNKLLTIIIICVAILAVLCILKIDRQVRSMPIAVEAQEPKSYSYCIEFKARITKYGWTGNKMANGQYPEEGFVATSNRKVPFGTKVIIENVEYEVGDRTADWVEDEFEYTTFDIYSELTREEMLDFGSPIKTVRVCNLGD